MGKSPELRRAGVHSYTTTVTDRTVMVRRIAFAAFALGLVVGIVLEQLGLTIPAYVTLPSPTAIFGVFFFLYDRWLWRLKSLGVQWSNMPDLAGRWSGQITIRKQAEGTPRGPRQAACRVRIEQSWSKISVQFETDFSKSRSVMASLALPGEELAGLRYQYQVRPRVGVETDEMQIHDGVARLEPVDGDWSHLLGDFFSDQYYQRYGEFELWREGHAEAAGEHGESEPTSRTPPDRGAGSDHVARKTLRPPE